MFCNCHIPFLVHSAFFINYVAVYSRIVYFKMQSYTFYMTISTIYS